MCLSQKTLLLPDIMSLSEQSHRKRASLGGDPGRPDGAARESDAAHRRWLDGAGGRGAARGPAGAHGAVAAARARLRCGSRPPRRDDHDPPYLERTEEYTTVPPALQKI